MTMTGLESIPNDLDKELDDFDRRLHQLEQSLTSSTIMGASGSNNFPTGIIIGGVPLDATNPNQVGTVVATPGAYYNNIYVDVTWIESAVGTDSTMFDIELAKVLAGPIYQTVTIRSTAGTHIRFEQLEPNTNYAVRIWAVSRFGIRPTATPAWTAFSTGQDTTAPSVMATPVVGRGATTVVVKFTPLPQASDPDVANGNGIYEIHIDTTTGFASGNLRTTFTQNQVFGFNDVLTQGTWYGRVRAIDSSGNAGPWSPTSSSATAGGVIDSMIVAGLDAAKITVGFLSATVIGDNTLPVQKITTSTLTATVITLGTGGAIRVGSGSQIEVGAVPTTNGIIINGSGLYAYGSSALKLAFDVSTGNLSITGNINGSTITGGSISGGAITGGTIDGAVITGGVVRTSASGSRIELRDSGSSYGGGLDDQIVLYSTNTFQEPGRIYAINYGIGGASQAVVIRSGARFGAGGTHVYGEAEIVVGGWGDGGGTAGIELYPNGGWVSITSGDLEVRYGRILMSGSAIQGTYDGLAPFLAGREGHGHTTSWNAGGGVDELTLCIDANDALTFQWDSGAGRLNFFWFGTYIGTLAP